MTPGVVLGTCNLGVDEPVNGLVRDELFPLFMSKPASDLLWRPTLCESDSTCSRSVNSRNNGLNRRAIWIPAKAGMTGLMGNVSAKTLERSTVNVVRYHDDRRALVIDHGLVVFGPVGVVCVGGRFVDFT